MGSAEPSEPRKPKPYSNYIRFSGLGLQLFLTIGLAAWIGNKLDAYLQLQFPAFLLSFVLIAFGGSMYFLYKALNKE